MSASATLIKFGSASWKAAGYLSMIAQIRELAYYMHSLKSINALFVNSQWKADKDIINFNKNKFYFHDYRQSCLSQQRFLVAEKTMTIVTSFLEGWAPDSLSQCSNAVYYLTAAHTVYSTYLLVAQPHLALLDKVFFSTVATLQVTPLVLKTVQNIWPEHQDNNNMNIVIDWGPTVATGFITARSVYDLTVLGHNFCASKSSHQPAVHSTTVTVPSDNTVPLLNTPHNLLLLLLILALLIIRLLRNLILLKQIL